MAGQLLNLSDPPFPIYKVGLVTVTVLLRLVGNVHKALGAGPAT